MSDKIERFEYPKKFTITEEQWKIIDKYDGKVPLKWFAPWGYGIKIPVEMHEEAKARMTKDELHEWYREEAKKLRVDK
jgi:hypothetical protein